MFLRLVLFHLTVAFLVTCIRFESPCIASGHLVLFMSLGFPYYVDVLHLPVISRKYSVYKCFGGNKVGKL